MSAVHYETVREGRDHIRELMDAAVDGRPATVQRDTQRAAVVDAERLRHFLSKLIPSHALVVAEGGGWSIMIPGLPVAADAASLDEALDEMVAALREYADDWADHLLQAPNHRDNWGLVQLIELSTDAQLKDWLQE